MHFQWEGPNTAVMRPVDRLWLKARTTCLWKKLQNAVEWCLQYAGQWGLDYYAALAPIGRITRLARLSIRPSVPYGFVSRKQKHRKNQNYYKRSTRHEQVECQFSDEKVKGQRSKSRKSTTIGRHGHVYLRAEDQAQAPTASKLGLTIVRPNLLSAPEPETLGNWTDGHISCRHSARHLFLLEWTWRWYWYYRDITARLKMWQ